MKVGQNRRIRRLVILGTAFLFALAICLFFIIVPPESFLSAVSIPERKEGEMRIHFLSVGQGDATIIESPSGKILVVDTASGESDCRNHLIRYLKGLHPESISIMVTHSQSDHCGGAKSLMRVFAIDKVYLPAEDGNSSIYREMRDEIESRQIPCERILAGGLLSDESGAYALCLSPDGEQTDNDASTVLYVSYQGIRTLLCGDISSSREEELVSLYRENSAAFDSDGFEVCLEQIEVLKVAHHGSKYSVSPTWERLLQPRAAIFSVGEGNIYKHPSQAALESYRDSEIYRTDDCGDITIHIYNGTYSVTTDLGRQHA